MVLELPIRDSARLFALLLGVSAMPGRSASAPSRSLCDLVRSSPRNQANTMRRSDKFRLKTSTRLLLASEGKNVTIFFPQSDDVVLDRNLVDHRYCNRGIALFRIHTIFRNDRTRDAIETSS